MKKIFILIIFFLIPAISYAQPKITFDSFNHDFGVVSQDEKAMHFFEFHNTGDQDLVIEKITSS